MSLIATPPASEENANPQGIFFNKLNVNQIAAFGHSQGAGGAGHAMIKSWGKIKTAILIELLVPIWCTLGPNCLETASITSGSVFFIDWSTDLPTSPPTRSAQTPSEQPIEAFYNAVPNNVAKVKGTLIRPNHNDVQGQPDCSHASFPRVNDVYGYSGYPTVWFTYHFQGDADAHGAFVNPYGEMFSESKNLEFVGSNVP